MKTNKIVNQKDSATRALHLKRMKMWFGTMANHEKYFDKNTGVFYEKYLEPRDCPACNSVNHRIIFKKSGGIYAACNDCEMIFLNPVFKDKYLREFYENNHNLQGEVVAEDIDFYGDLYSKGLRQILECGGQRRNLLDVGCSSGIFLDIAKEDGWNTIGLELNKKEAERARQKGHLVKEVMLDSLDDNEKFDVITLWDVFEHIKDGVSFLEQAKNHLQSSGLIFIQSPSRDALAARIMQAQCNMFDGLEHVNLYGFESLKKVAKAAGYNLLKFKTVIPEVGVLENYLGYQDPYLGIVEANNQLSQLLDKDRILSSGLGYKFQICLSPL
jgi:SAM-dependent methyltransferase